MPAPSIAGAFRGARAASCLITPAVAASRIPENIATIDLVVIPTKTLQALGPWSLQTFASDC